MKIRILIICLFVSILVSANDNRRLLDFYKGGAALPSFLYNNNDMVYGVSDPGMDTLLARHMAITRAIFVHAIKNKASLRMLTDFYTKNKQVSSSYDVNREKCLTLANLNFSSVTYRYNIVEENTNDRGETFVCLEISENADSCLTISANCDFMASYDFDSKENREFKVLMSITSQNDNNYDSMDYSVKGSLDNPIILSQFSNYKQRFYRNAFWYYDEGTIKEDENVYSMSNALWCAMVESLCDNLVCVAFDNTNIKNLNESYNDSNESLSRELVNSKVSCIPVISGIKRNKISIKWKVREL